MAYGFGLPYGLAVAYGLGFDTGRPAGKMGAAGLTPAAYGSGVAWGCGGMMGAAVGGADTVCSDGERKVRATSNPRTAALAIPTSSPRRTPLPAAARASCRPGMASNAGIGAPAHRGQARAASGGWRHPDGVRARQAGRQPELAVHASAYW
jgi:hypothetical protein